MSSNAPVTTPLPLRPVLTTQQINESKAALTELHINNFPSSISTIPSWLMWRPTPNHKLEPTKLLKRPLLNNWQAGTTTTLSDIATQFSSHPPSDPVGLGFVYTPDHPFICIDIDNFSEDNLALLSSLNTYTEVSPSSNGAHAIIALPSTEDKQILMLQFANGKRSTSNKRDLFISSGYTTMTGRIHPLSTDDIRVMDAYALIDALEPYFQAHNPDAPSITQVKDAYDKGVRLTPNKDRQALLPDKNALSKAQVYALLQQLPVTQLPDDIFTRLYHGENAVLDPTCTDEAREPWLIIGQAIHHNFKGHMSGFALWDEWSQLGNKYDADACLATWTSFKKDQSDASNVTIGALIKLVAAQQPQFIDFTSKGQPLGTAANFRVYFQFYKFKAYYNEITKESKIEIPPAKLESWGLTGLLQDLSMGEICTLMASDFKVLRFTGNAYSTREIKSLLTGVVKLNSRNHVREYFESCAARWDGVDRITTLASTVTPNISRVHMTQSYQMFIRKWLLQVVVAACHKPSNPARLNRVLILAGPQDIGKTNWVASLFPTALRKYCLADKEIRLSSFRSDNVKLTMELSNTLICNINEIDRMFRHANFADFKAFLDQTTDNVVFPYGETPTEVSRRTVFIGSTNMPTFLKDPTGNRRFEVLHVDKLNAKHGIDIDQLWGQVHSLYVKGEKWWLSPSNPVEAQAIKDRDDINAGTMYITNDAIAEKLYDMYDVEKFEADGTVQHIKFKDVRLTLGLPDMSVNGRLFNSVKASLRAWSIDVTKQEPTTADRPRAPTIYCMPPVRTEMAPTYSHLPDSIDPTDEEENLRRQIKALQEKLKTTKTKN